MQTIKEKKLLLKFAMQMGQPVDPALVEEVKRYDEMQQKIIDSVKISSQTLFGESVKQEEAKEPELTPVARTEEVAPISLAEKAAKAIKPMVTEADSFQPPSVIPPADLKAVKDKIKFLEQWIGKVSLAGPGSGAGDISTLSQQSVSVTSNTYTATRKDYYIGVNYAGKVTVYLPTSPVQGREVIVKDESGNCGAGINRWITIRTADGLNIDGKNAANLAINYGSLTFVNRNGWRIV